MTSGGLGTGCWQFGFAFPEATPSLGSPTVVLCTWRKDLHDHGERDGSLHRSGGLYTTSVKCDPGCGRRDPARPLHRAPPIDLRDGRAQGEEPRRWTHGRVRFGFRGDRLPAVSMQQGVEHDSQSRPQEIGLRVGVSTGEVTFEDDDYFGDPVIEAARLCARCAGGQILASDLVRLNAGRRNPHPSSPVGELELKGLPDPVATVEVHWEPVVIGRDSEPALPGLLTEAGRFPFAGRQKEAEQLLGAPTGRCPPVRPASCSWPASRTREDPAHVGAGRTGRRRRRCGAGRTE